MHLEQISMSTARCRYQRTGRAAWLRVATGLLMASLLGACLAPSRSGPPSAFALSLNDANLDPPDAAREAASRPARTTLAAAESPFAPSPAIPFAPSSTAPVGGDAARLTQETDPSSLGRFSFDVLAAAEFSQDSGSFSEVTPLVYFTGDTAWGPPNKDAVGSEVDIHTVIGLKFSGIPTEKAGTTVSQDFVESRKAFTGEIGMDWRAFHFQSEQGSTKHVLFVGPSTRYGIQSLAEDNTNPELDSVNNFWLIGGRMGEYTVRDDAYNSRLNRWVGVYFGDYESFGHDRLAVEAALGLPNSKLVVGVKFIGGAGHDDLRFFVGFSNSLEDITKGFTGLIDSMFASTPTTNPGGTDG